MKKGNSLLPDIPEEFRGVRLGRCFNSLIRELLLNQPSFDLGKLRHENLLHFTPGRAKLKIQANASSTDFAQESFFGTSTSAEVSAYGVKGSAGFHLSNAQKSTSNSYEFNCYIHYVFTGQSMEILLGGPETYYKCMMPNFKRHYDAIMNSETAQDYFNAYTSFLTTFGTGCVTKLYLASGSACKVSVTRSESGNAVQTKFGGSIGLGTPVGGASSATEWGTQMATADSEAVMHVDFESLPQDTATRDWAAKLSEKYMDKAISVMAQSSERPSEPDSNVKVEAPNIPKVETPKDEKPPKPKLGKGEKDKVSEVLIKKLMEEDKFLGSVEDYKMAQAERLKALTPTNVAKEAREVIGQSKSVQTDGTKVDAEDVLMEMTKAEFHAKVVKSKENVWDLGGYIPVGYEVTSWQSLFPDLNMGLPPSMSRIWLAKLWTFYLTRLEFSQYLFFLTDVGTSESRNHAIASDANVFAELCKKFSGKMTEDVGKHGTFLEENYIKLIKGFHKDVEDAKNTGLFYSDRAYENFFVRYELFRDNPLGFIVIDKDLSAPGGMKYYYTSLREAGGTHVWKKVQMPVSIPAMLADAKRLYPILTPDGEYGFRMAAFSDTSFQAWLGDVQINQIESRPNRFYEWGDVHGNKFYAYGVGWEHVRALGRNPQIFGGPMLGELPFDRVKNGTVFKGFDD